MSNRGVPNNIRDLKAPLPENMQKAQGFSHGVRSATPYDLMHAQVLSVALSVAIAVFLYWQTRSLTSGLTILLGIFLAYLARQQFDFLTKTSQVALEVLRESEAKQRFISDIIKTVAAPQDLHSAIESLGKRLIPLMGDWVIIDRRDEESILRRMTVQHSNPSFQELARQIQQTRPDLNAAGGSGLALRKNHSVIVPQISGSSLWTSDPFEAQWISKMGTESYVTVLLPSSEKAVIAITVISKHAGRYSSNDVLFLEEIARRCGPIIDNILLFQKAQDAIRARDDALAVVSHDLKNPIGAVKLNVCLMLRILEHIDQWETRLSFSKAIARISASTLRAERLIHNLLDLGQVDSGRLKIDRQSTDFKLLIKEALEMLRPLAAEKKIRIETTFDDGDYYADCDRERFFQVLSNLVGNAIKFTPAGGVIEIFLSSPTNFGPQIRGQDQGTFHCCIRDSGPGIAPDQLPHIFDRYWQAKKTNRLGTGLGLSIAKGIVEAHGGQIWADSEVGRGSEFYFSIPAAQKLRIAT